MEKIQYLDWGRIEWICEPESGSSDHLRVGISVMNPHSWQPCHLHYGDEQFMYIMSGRGWQKIGDSESLVEPGKYFHISSGATCTVEITAGMETRSFTSGSSPSFLDSWLIPFICLWC